MNDISPSLLNEIKKTFQNAYSSSAKIKSLLNSIEDYESVTRYAEEVGRLVSLAFTKHLTASNLPNGILYQNIAESVVIPTLRDAYKLIAKQTTIVQQNLNDFIGIGLQAIEPSFNYERAKNLVDKISDFQQPIEETKWLIEDNVIENFTRSVVTDAIEDNAEYQEDAGIHAYITRYSVEPCCEWCESKKGTYEYGKQPDDFFQVHKDCICIIEYHPSRVAYKRITFRTNNDNSLNKITTTERK